MPDVIHHTHPKETGPNLYLEPFDDHCFAWKRPCFEGLTLKNRGHLVSRYMILCEPPANKPCKEVNFKNCGAADWLQAFGFPFAPGSGQFLLVGTSQGAWYKEPLTKTKLWRHRKNQRFFSSCAHFHERFGKNSNHLLHILQKLLLLRVIPTMTFQNSHARLYLNLIVSGEGC